MSFTSVSNIVIENTKEASYRIRTKINNVAGVKLPVFDRAIGTVTGKGESALSRQRTRGTRNGSFHTRDLV
jgi:vacuolar-type H+-ATPase subunit D/Vma8